MLSILFDGYRRRRIIDTIVHEYAPHPLPGTTAPPIISIEVLIEQDQVFPVGVVGIARVVPMARPLPILISHKDVGNAMADLLTDLEQCHHLPRPSGTFNLQLIPIVKVIAFQGFRYQEVHWKLRKWYVKL